MPKEALALRTRGRCLIAIVALAGYSCTKPAQMTSPRVPAQPPTIAGKQPEPPGREPKSEEDRQRRSPESAGRDHDRDMDAGDSEEAAERASRASALDAYRFFLAKRVRAGETELPFERYQAAREHAGQMAAFSFGRPGEADFYTQPRASNSSSGGGWTSLGPGNIGGRTRSILIDPTNPLVVYAGAVTGGVWKTTDGGQTWNPLTDLLPVLNVGALAMDPTNSRTIYAGTGESYVGFPGQGIFKTTDGGATWAQLPATAGFIYTNKLVVSVKNSQRIYAATSTGVWTSSNGGTTWTQSLGILGGGCQDLALRTDTTADYLFASCARGASTSDYAIWRNQDAAGSGVWAMVHTAPHMVRTSLALAPSRQSTIYALAASYGGTQGYDNGLLAVFRSASNGDPGTWATTVANTDPNPINTDLLSSLSCTQGTPPSYGQGWYDNVLAVDPLNPNVVWAGGVNLFRSDDGGAKWSVVFDLTFATSTHVDHHAIVFHPGYNGASNQTMFLGNDGGLYRTDNALAPVVQQPPGSCPPARLSVTWTDLNTSYVATQFYHGVSYPGGGAYFGGAQDNGVSRGSDAVGPDRWSWLPAAIGDGGQVAIDPADANTIFWCDALLTLQRSDDNGVNFVTQAVSGITEPNTPFKAAFAMDPNNGREMFLGGATNLWRTVDGANSWTAAAAVEAQSYVTAISVSPADFNTVLFGTATGRIYRSSSALATDGSDSWQFALPRGGFVQGIAFDWKNPNIVYATYSTFNSPGDAHVYKSTDGGVTWTASEGSGASAIPDIPVFRLLVNPYDSSMLFLGTDLGVFVSIDGGNSWRRDANPFNDVITEDLVVDQGSQSQWLFAFTYGRGAYRAALPGASGVPCNYAVTPASISVPAWGGIYPVTVTAPPACAWVAMPGTDTTMASVQSPAQGSGNGTAWVVAEPWYYDRGPQTLTIAGQAVTVSQQGSFGAPPGDETVTAAVISVPGTGFGNTQNYTANPNDPVHSCTNSADSNTAWWKVLPGVSGTMQVEGLGRRATSYGNYGLVLTAYAGTTASPTAELGCTVVPRDTAANVSGFLRFPVAAGTAYLIEASAAASPVKDAGSTSISVRMVSGAVTVSIVPGVVQLTAGGAPQQFSGGAANGPNPAVRWSLSPAIGTITPGGLYTPPAAVTAAATVTLTASAFANPQVQATATIHISPEPVVTLQTNPPGLHFSVDGGVSQTSPQSLTLLPGTHTIAVTATQSDVNCNGYGYTATATIAHRYVAANANNYTATIAGTWPTLATVGYGGQVTNGSGYDICFANAANTAKLKWELESYNGATGAIVVHVLVGTVSSTADTTFSVYYGNSSISTFQGGSVGSAWDGSAYPYLGVWHLGDGTVLHGNDSSANGNNLANHGAVATSGEIGGAAAFSSAYMTAIPSSSLDFSGAASFSFWENPASLGGAVLASRTACNAGNWQIYDSVSGGLYFNFWSGSANVQAFTRTQLSLGVWSYVVVTYDGSAARFYVNGSLTNTVPMSGTRNSDSNTFNVGTESCRGYLHGSLDEVRVAQGAWPSTLIQTMYNNQAAPGTFVTLSGMTQVNPPSAPAGMQYVFTGWSDGGAASHSITVGASAAAYTANFKTQYQLTNSPFPAAGGTVTPATGTFYDAGTVVPIAATANAGYAFTGWTGAVGDAASAATTVTMSAAESVTANFSSPAGASAPSITSGGIVPVNSTVPTIQPGEWVSIFGARLAGSTVIWNGDFPTSLGGTSVTINGRAAYLSFVSPTQINLQAPDDTSTGSVPVVVTTPGGTAASTVTLAQFAPSFILLDGKHVTGIILRANGSGAYGGGTYDLIGPTGNSLGYPTVAAKAGDTIELFAVGLGPTNPAVPAGQAYSSAAPTTYPVNLLINKLSAIPAFAGLSSAGLYQINLTVPAGLGTGEVPLVATVGGVQTPPAVVISLQ
jgi:uncharacterized protein (TIGR03437 family)